MSNINHTAIDLFCGAGGLTVGLKKAGFRVLAGIENNPIAAETYKLNNRAAKIYQDDIRMLCPTTVMQELGLKRGELDLLAGCPPCQGFSSHRTRNKATSIEDERNDLVFEFIRFVEAMLPKTVMLENVPALAKDWRVHELKSRLHALGYQIDDAFAQVKDAADYGVPQRRKRLLVKASRFGKIPDAHPVKERRTVKDAIADLLPPGMSGDPLHDFPTSRSEKVKNLISMVPRDGGSRSDIPKKYWLNCHLKRPDSYRDVYGRMAWKDVAPTITGGCTNPSKGRFIHPEEDRPITLREAALLQTFPPRYRFSTGRGKDAVALMIGNALPPEFIRRQAVQYRAHLQEVERG
ncbi:DNA cytosine methyltransferase [Burkholderia pseudomallei]|uniref:DNA cytosine methyltransferase n=1 Tax=Burkholderia pseudomallei TaxID=28450 RepID=UPI00052AD77D|nr:DNA cytosine methyltransferase [Burkholderia pseudomallei]AIV81749.1 DNA (cytosine-5-)-methyltransferase family protein [Burkholderia pseudomallei MSHR3965]KGT01615.1 DNA (cytosine-5-)-methyltransferase family protein [Burkholderia pseudomallei]KGU88849.1 DNA (cytosine-5-)-methyltransferase family protein [Burkholderia pseudomallei MSHR4372]KGW13354.1 DNA (cytosine-5-)-methyltransferase family protein [Burkholderia pseudomallei MSHR4000]